MFHEEEDPDAPFDLNNAARKKGVELPKLPGLPDFTLEARQRPARDRAPRRGGQGRREGERPAHRSVALEPARLPAEAEEGLGPLVVLIHGVGAATASSL